MDDLMETCRHEWITCLKQIFDEHGLNYIWTSQNVQSQGYLK